MLKIKNRKRTIFQALRVNDRLSTKSSQYIRASETNL